MASGRRIVPARNRCRTHGWRPARQLRIDLREVDHQRGRSRCACRHDRRRRGNVAMSPRSITGVAATSARGRRRRVTGPVLGIARPAAAAPRRPPAGPWAAPGSGSVAVVEASARKRGGRYPAPRRRAARKATGTRPMPIIARASARRPRSASCAAARPLRALDHHSSLIVFLHCRRTTVAICLPERRVNRDPVCWTTTTRPRISELTSASSLPGPPAKIAGSGLVGGKFEIGHLPVVPHTRRQQRRVAGDTSKRN